jgi:GT2 family glycosyltransferase
MPALSIILVNYRRPDDTVECVRSLSGSTFRDVQIIIVDNGSGDGSTDRLRRECAGTILITSPRNVGFAGGNNLGIRRALDDGSRFILLLNNDTIIDPGTIEALMATIRAGRRTGIVGAKIVYYDRPDILWFAGGYLNPNAARAGHHGIGKPDGPAFHSPKPCEYVTGCCLLARREVFEAVGMLPTPYFAYMEDAEFCLRTRRAGYAVLYEPRARVLHKISMTTRWDSPAYIYLNLRNKLLFLKRNSRPALWAPHLPSLLYFYLRQMIRLLLRGHGPVALRAAWYAIIDGLRGFTGEDGSGRLPLLLATGETKPEQRTPAC